jgi:hypothetical protein
LAGGAVRGVCCAIVGGPRGFASTSLRSPRAGVAPGALVVVALLAALAGLPALARAAPTFTFAPDPGTPLLPAGYELSAVADVNGDGVPDLILVDQYGGTVGVMLGDGDGGFGSLMETSVGGGRPTHVQVADFNGDGHPDLLVGLETAASPRQPNPGSEAFEVMTGDGRGFTPGPRTALKEAGFLYAGDFNGDGHQDVAEIPSCGGTLAGWIPSDNHIIYTFAGDGSGGFAPATETSVGEGTCWWEEGDLNGDGRTDLVAVSQGLGPSRVIVEPGAASGGFGPAVESPLGTALFLRGQPIDLDGDRTLDLLAEGATSQSEGVYTLANDGSAHFSLHGPYPAGATSFGADPVAGEFAGEGHPTILTIRGSVTALEPGPAGALEPLQLTPYHGPENDIWVADVNRDGRPDLILANQTALSILLDEPAVPVLSSVRMAPRLWRDGTASARISRRRVGSRRAPQGTSVTFSLNVPASVTLAFSKRLVRRHGRGRLRYGSSGSLVLAAHAGLDTIAFDGVLPGARPLAPGVYELALTASNVSGSSHPATVSFTVAAAPRKTRSRRR